MHRFAFALLTAAVLATPACAQASDANLIARLRDADTNHDGAVTREEFFAYRAQQFGRLDRNGDGALTAEDRPRLAQAGSGAGKGQARMAGLRETFDANGDGRVERAEFVNGPTPVFDQADANRDGIVTQDELRAAAARAR